MATADMIEELPPTAAVDARREPKINVLFRTVMRYEASDLHLKVGLAPMMRLKGVIRKIEAPPISEEQMERLFFEIMNPRLRKILEDTGGADFAHVIGADECRFRVNILKQRGHLGMVARRVNNKVPTFEGLGLPPSIEQLCKYDQGMIILAGVTGSGKSTTIASMLDYLNEREALHILTIEDPIEYLFADKKSVVNQREVGIDVCDWHTALKHAVREDPDVILVGEMRDRDTFEAAIHAAETGHLVFGTIHASSAASTLGRILDLFPADMHQAIRQTLAFNLKAVVAQKLLPSIVPGRHRVPTNEIGYLEGMVDFTENLRQLVERGDVSKEVALEVAPNPDALKMAIKGIKVATPGILCEV